MRATLLCLGFLAFGLTGCGPPPTADSVREDGGFRPIEPAAADLWDRQTTETGALLAEFVEEFNAAEEGLDVKLVHTGNYGDIFRKVLASIQAGALPSMAVAYETMTAEYVRKGAAAELDAFVTDPELGYSEAELDDFFPAVLDTNRYAEFDNKLYSFPFTKSVLLLYYNNRVLARSGIDAPPETWDSFLDQSRRIKAATGNAALSFNVSASTLVGMIYSMGGEILGEGESHFDSPASLRAFTLLETMVTEELIYQNPPRTFEDQNAFGQDRLAFNFRPSSSLFYVARMMEDYDTWGVRMIPRDPSVDPVTVLYGANICIFQTTPEQTETAWRFVKYFTSPEVTARWSMGTGYLPLRKSAADSPAMQEFFSEHPQHRVPYDALSHGRPEPNVIAWQEMRGLIENALVAVLTKVKTGEQAARDLKAEADALLERHTR